MSDCRYCDTRITDLRDYWIHLNPAADNHVPEPLLGDAWHKRSADRDHYGHRWPRLDAEIQLPTNFYDRGKRAT